MLDMTTIASAVSSLKAAGDIAKGLIDLRDAASQQTKVIELQSLILSAQTSALAAHADQFSLIERIRQLEQEVAENSAWAKEASRYELVDFGGGTFAYTLKADSLQGEPNHHVCAACYQVGHKSILQCQGHNALAQELHHCPRCEKDFALGARRETFGYSQIREGTSWMSA